MLTGFEHAAIAVADLDAAQERYRRLLGRTPAREAAGGVEAATFELGNARITLLAATGAGAAAERVRARLDGDGEGLCGIAFATADVAACAAALGAASVEASDAGGLTLARDAARGLWIRVMARRETPRVRAVEAPTPGAVVALDHVVVNTTDADAAIALYRDRLGIRLALDREFPGRGARLSFLRVGGVTVELAARAGAREDAGNDRFYGLAYRVTDIAAAHDRLARDGFEPSAARPGNKPGTEVLTVRAGTCGVPTLVIRDPAREG